MEVDQEYYEDPKYYDTLHRAQQEAAYRPASTMDGLLQVGQSGISLVALAGLLVSFRWWVGVILFAATLPGVLLRLKYADHMYDWLAPPHPGPKAGFLFPLDADRQCLCQGNQDLCPGAALPRSVLGLAPEAPGG